MIGTAAITRLSLPWLVERAASVRQLAWPVDPGRLGGLSNAEIDSLPDAILRPGAIDRV